VGIKYLNRLMRELVAAQSNGITIPTLAISPLSTCPVIDVINNPHAALISVSPIQLRYVAQERRPLLPLGRPARVQASGYR